MLAAVGVPRSAATTAATAEGRRFHHPNRVIAARSRIPRFDVARDANPAMTQLSSLKPKRPSAAPTCSSCSSRA
jgi:hypothetical protein